MKTMRASRFVLPYDVVGNILLAYSALTTNAEKSGLKEGVSWELGRQTRGGQFAA
jgi:hypothetical protein